MSYAAFAMAQDRVRQRLLRVTQALQQAEIDYAVAGGNAVAAWVARVDPAATRTTRDVDLLVRKMDLDRIDAAMSRLGFERVDLRRLVRYTDPDEPSRRAGVHLVWAGAKVWPSYAHATPTVDEAELDPEGYRLLVLPALVRMKLTSFRDIDRVHVADLLEVGLIDADVRDQLADDLLDRLDEIARSRDFDE